MPVHKCLGVILIVCGLGIKLREAGISMSSHKNSKCTKNTFIGRVAEVRSRTSVRTLNPRTEPKVRSSSGSGSLFWGRFSSWFQPWVIGLNLFEPTSVMGYLGLGMSMGKPPLSSKRLTRVRVQHWILAHHSTPRYHGYFTSKLQVSFTIFYFYYHFFLFSSLFFCYVLTYVSRCDMSDHCQPPAFAITHPCK